MANELSLVHKSQRGEQRDLTTRCDVSGGRPRSLICLQIQSSLGAALPSPPPSEPNNLNVGLHAHVIINKLCPCPFHPRQNKNKVKSAWLPTAMSRITHVHEVLQSRGRHQILQTLLWTTFSRVSKAAKCLFIFGVGQLSDICNQPHTNALG